MKSYIIVFIGIVFLSNSINADNLDFGNDLLDMDILRMGIRDAEYFPKDPLSLGHKEITGGLGEGDQYLENEHAFKHREQVKSDSVLPAYCEPPNPCPVGYDASHGCIEEFENTAEFSRKYQAQQECLCDQEHMFDCPADQKNVEKEEEGDDNENGIEDMNIEEFEEKTVAKKSPPPFVGEDMSLRRKRFVPVYENYHQVKRFNPYLQGEPLKTISKKSGKQAW